MWGWTAQRKKESAQSNMLTWTSHRGISNNTPQALLRLSCFSGLQVKRDHVARFWGRFCFDIFFPQTLSAWKAWLILSGPWNQGNYLSTLPNDFICTHLLQHDQFTPFHCMTMSNLTFLFFSFITFIFKTEVSSFCCKNIIQMYSKCALLDTKCRI